MAPIIIIIIIFLIGSKDPMAKNKVYFSSNWIYYCSSRLPSSRIDELLQSNDNIHVIPHDCSKTFDSVRHHNLASELASVTMPDYICN